MLDGRGRVCPEPGDELAQIGPVVVVHLLLEGEVGGTGTGEAVVALVVVLGAGSDEEESGVEDSEEHADGENEQSG